MRETSFLAKLRMPRGTVAPVLGGGVEFIIPTIPGLRRPSAPVPLTPRGTLSGRTHPCLFKVPHHIGGHTCWLLFSWNLTNATAPLTHHQDLLTQTEPPPYTAIWLDPTPIYANWVGPTLRSIRIPLAPKILAPLYHPDCEGPPDERGHWLAHRLLPPRSLPGALRRFSRTLWQLWFPL